MSQENKRNLNETKRKIVNAATRIFAEKGLSGARIDQIAREADVNKAMIYYIFSSKEGLYQSILTDIVREISNAAISQVEAANVTLENIMTLVSNYFEIIEKNRYSVLILTRESVAGAPFLRKIKEEEPQTFAAFIKVVDRIKVLSQNGIINEVHPTLSVLAIMAFGVMIVSFEEIQKILLEQSGGELQQVDFKEWSAFANEMVLRYLKPE